MTRAQGRQDPGCTGVSIYTPVGYRFDDEVLRTRSNPPEMRPQALRMLAAAWPERATMIAVIRHVAGLRGMMPETPQLLQRRYEVHAGEGRQQDPVRPFEFHASQPLAT